MPENNSVLDRNGKEVVDDLGQPEIKNEARVADNFESDNGYDKLSDFQKNIIQDFRKENGKINEVESVIYDEYKDSYNKYSKKTGKFSNLDATGLKNYLYSKKKFKYLGKSNIGYLVNEIPYVTSLFDVDIDKVWTYDEEDDTTTYNMFDLQETMMTDCEKIRDEQGLINKVDFIKSYPATNLLFDNVYGIEKEEDLKYVLNYYSTIINERKKLRVSFVTMGEQQEGKGFLLEQFLKPVFHYVNELQNAHLEDKDNKMLGNTNFAVFNEVQTDIKGTIHNKIKSMITDPYLIVKFLYSNPVSVKNQINMQFFSNNMQSLRVDYGDQRFSIFKTKGHLETRVKEEMKINMKQFEKMFQDELKYFVNDLKRYNYDSIEAGKALENNAKQAMAASTTTKLEALKYKLNRANYIEIEEDILEIEAISSNMRTDSVSGINIREELRELKINMTDGFLNFRNQAFLYNTLIDDEGKAGSPNKVSRVFNAMVPNKVKRNGNMIRLLKCKFEGESENDISDDTINMDGTIGPDHIDETLEVIENMDNRSSLEIKEDEEIEFIKDQEEKGNVMF